MELEEFPWLWVPGALLLLSLILYGVDAAWMTPLYVAEMLMFIILGAERSEYSRSKPLAALLAVGLWIGGQLLLWLGWDASLLWAVVVLETLLAYAYFYTRRLRLPRTRLRYDYSALAMLLLIFFTIGRLALSADLYQALWALGIFIIAAADFFVADIAAADLRRFKKYSWVGYLAPLGALISAYAAIAVAAPGLPLAII